MASNYFASQIQYSIKQEKIPIGYIQLVRRASMKNILSIALLFLLSNFALSQSQKLNAVPGLELTPDIKVLPNTKQIVVNARTEGNVKWLVISNKPCLYKEDSTKKTLTFNNVEDISTINVFAIATTKNGLTDFANTKITVEGAKAPEKPSDKYSVTIYVNYNSLTPEQNKIINVPYADFGGKYNSITFKTIDITSLSDDQYKDAAKNFPQGMLIVKDTKNNNVYFGNIPKDLKLFTDILDNLQPKGN